MGEIILAKKCIKSLGYVIEQGKIGMNIKKVKAIQEWKTRNIKEIRSFLELENYYYWFVKGDSKKATPLIELLKKDVP